MSPDRQGRCDHCGRPGEPYVYREIRFDGLHADRGERLCTMCLGVAVDRDGVNIHVSEPDRGIDYVYNSVRDADKAPIWIPHELRGVDGRDTPRRARRRRRR
jgi:hypothetical protein